MDGRRVRQSTGERTERKTRMVEAELKVQMKAQLKYGQKSITLATALEHYAKSAIAQGYTSIPGGKIGDAEERILRRTGEDTFAMKRRRMPTGSTASIRHNFVP
jgi:hypothetical protein